MSIVFDHHADGTTNNCDSIRDWDNSDKVLYNEIRPLAAGQHLEVIYPIVINAGFNNFGTIAFTTTYKTSGVNAKVSVSRIVDSNGVEQSTGFPAAAQSATKAQFDITAASLTGTYVKNTVVYVFVKGEGDASEVAFIGPTVSNVKLK